MGSGEVFVMDNQHKKISGYRDLSQDEIDLMNEVKDMSSKVGKMISKLENDISVDKHWLGIGKTNLQQGFMDVVRSIAKPTTF